MVFAAPNDALARAKGVLDADPTPLHASVAHQVIGIWQRDWGDMRIALYHLRRARDLAARAESADREADVLAALGVALVHAGRTQQGLAALERGVERGSGHTRARVLFRRAYARWVLGHHREALEDVRKAIPVLRQMEDVIWTARALTLRATVHLAVGAVDRADADFTAAEALWDTTGQEHDKADAVESRGLAAFRSGDIPAALRLLDEAEERYAKLGTPTFMLNIRRCEVLMAAGLAREALTEADAAIAVLDGIGGQSTRKAELLLAAARAARLAGEAHTAIARADMAVRLFAGQRRGWWETHARLVLIEARVAAGRSSGRLVADTAAVAERLASFGAPAAPEASLLAGRIALGLGWRADAEQHLAVAARSRRSGPPLARMTGWAAQALRAQAAGSGRGVLEACRRGLDVLDAHRMTLGASELRARATEQGAELAALAQQASLDSGSPRRLLVWSERWRATALSTPPTRPPADPELQSNLTAFREIAARAEAARMEARPVPALEREQRRLEREIRSRTLHIRGDTPGDGHRFDPGRLLERLGDDVRLAELAVLDGRVQVLLCGQGRVRRYEAGLLADAERRPSTSRPGCGGWPTRVRRVGFRWSRRRGGAWRSCCSVRPRPIWATAPWWSYRRAGFTACRGRCCRRCGSGCSACRRRRAVGCAPGRPNRRPVAGMCWYAARDWRPAARKCRTWPAGTADRSSWSTRTRACRVSWRSSTGPSWRTSRRTARSVRTARSSRTCGWPTGRSSSMTSSAWTAARTGSSCPAATPPASPPSAPTNCSAWSPPCCRWARRAWWRAARRSTTRRWCR